MSDTHASPEAQGEPGRYEIRVRGRLDQRWSDWFGGFTITCGDDGDSLLIGPVVDQAALHGLLAKIRDLGVPLLSVMLVEPTQAHVPDVKP
jgi:hypothetical protein